MANRRDPLKAPTEISANRQCPPRKETRSPSGRCVHRAASSRTYCRPGEREGLKKTRATTSQVFWAAGNRRTGACADSRGHCLPEAHETQPCAPAAFCRVNESNCDFATTMGTDEFGLILEALPSRNNDARRVPWL